MKLKEKFSVIIEKVKSNKKLQFLLLGLLIAVILLVYFAYFIKETDDNATNTSGQVLDTTTEEYVNSLETKLANVLSDIEGAGKVSVAITVASGFAYEYAYEETSKDSLSTTTSSSNLILVDDKPVVVSQTYPTIAGVLVVAEGGESLKVKLDILQSIQTLLDVANDKITILDGKF